MRTKIPWEVENLDEYSWRVAVIGGWIVYSAVESAIGGSAITSVFVKDQDHLWVIRKPENEIPPSMVMEEFKSRD
jgi:hypothetical protein